MKLSSCREELTVKGFEPMGSADVHGLEPIPEDKFKRFTDVELLLELRRRGVLGRVDAHVIVPAYAVDDGYPIEHQMREAYRKLGDELYRVHLPHSMPPGSKVERGRFDGFMQSSREKDRKVTIVINYVREFTR